MVLIVWIFSACETPKESLTISQFQENQLAGTTKTSYNVILFQSIVCLQSDCCILLIFSNFSLFLFIVLLFLFFICSFLSICASFSFRVEIAIYFTWYLKNVYPKLQLPDLSIHCFKFFEKTQKFSTNLKNEHIL